jgi:hypothetical protein
MRRLAWLFLLAAVCAGLADCGGCGRRNAPAKPVRFADGFATTDDLARAYLDAIEKKDPDLLQRVMLSADDLAAVQKGAGKQVWQAYFMIAKRAFMDKNKPYLGQKLTFTGFDPGTVIMERGAVQLYRGAAVRFRTPDGKDGSSEINFVMAAGGTFKIFGLRYLTEELQRRGVMKNFAPFDGEAKFKGVGDEQDLNLKIKKLPKTGEDPAPEQPPGQ